MTKISTIDQNNLKAMRAPIESALADLGAQLGVKFKAGSGIYGGANGSIKLLIEIDSQEIQDAAKRADFERNCYLFGLKAEDYRARFSLKGRELELVGFNNSAKMPLCCVDDQGQTFRVALAVIPQIIVNRKVAEPA